MKRASEDLKQKGWDEYFLNIADEVAKKSKDPSSQNGCVIVDVKKRPVSFGYNGMIQGAHEDKMTLKERPMKYFFVIHSEMNALIFAQRDLSGCTLYNKMATCDNCLKHCLQAGVKRFVYRQLRVNSVIKGQKKSIDTLTADEAIIRLLASVDDVETLNISNGKSYTQDILDSYDPQSEEYARLARWL